MTTKAKQLIERVVNGADPHKLLNEASEVKIHPGSIQYSAPDDRSYGDIELKATTPHGELVLKNGAVNSDGQMLSSDGTWTLNGKPLEDAPDLECSEDSGLALSDRRAKQLYKLLIKDIEYWVKRYKAK